MQNKEQSKQETQTQPLAQNQAKLHALIAYAGLSLGLIFGLPWLFGGIWAIIKKADAKESKYISHYTNIIKTFWWSLGLSILGLILTTVIIGYFILLCVWVWSIYRVLKGLANITADKPY